MGTGTGTAPQCGCPVCESTEICRNNADSETEAKQDCMAEGNGCRRGGKPEPAGYRQWRTNDRIQTGELMRNYALCILGIAIVCLYSCKGKKEAEPLMLMETAPLPAIDDLSVADYKITKFVLRKGYKTVFWDKTIWTDVYYPETQDYAGTIHGTKIIKAGFVPSEIKIIPLKKGVTILHFGDAYYTYTAFLDVMNDSDNNLTVNILGNSAYEIDNRNNLIKLIKPYYPSLNGLKVSEPDTDRGPYVQK